YYVHPHFPNLSLFYPQASVLAVLIWRSLTFFRRGPWSFISFVFLPWVGTPHISFLATVTFSLFGTALLMFRCCGWSFPACVLFAGGRFSLHIVFLSSL